MNRIISLMLAMAIGLLLVSCPMAPPLEPTDSFNPYLSPPAVDSLQATNGQKDTIMLTWDKSEGATSYHIYRIDSDEYGAVNERITGSDSLSALQKRGFALLDVVDGNSYQMKAEPGSSYIFSVVAAKDLGPSVPAKSRMLYSKTGAFAQGSTLGEIRVFGIADARYVNLYWGIDNFYSKLASNEGRKEPLYQDYAFRILYRKAGALTWKDAYAPSNAFSSSMIVSQYGMEPDTDYEFRIDFTVAPDGSSAYTSSSRVFTIKTDRTMTPYKAFDFAVTTDEFGKVELEWKSYPAIGNYGVEDIFRIERSVKDSDSWSEIFCDSVELDESGFYRYSDRDAEDNTEYDYRIIHGYRNIENPEIVLFGDPSDKASGHKLWVPENASISFFEKESPSSTSGIVHFFFDFPLNPLTEDYGFSIDVIDYSNGSPTTRTKAFVSLLPSPLVLGRYEAAVDVSSSDGHFHVFDFELAYSYKGERVGSYRVSQLSGTPVNIGTVPEIISNASITNNLVGKVRLSWNVNDSSETITGYTIRKNDAVAAELGKDAVNAEIRQSEPAANYKIEVNVRVGERDVVLDYGEILTGSIVPSPTGLKATEGSFRDKIEIRWDPPAAALDGVRYCLEYWTYGSDEKEYAYDIDPASGLYTLETEDTSIHCFALFAYNSEDNRSLTPSAGMVYGYIFTDAVLFVNAEDHASPDSVKVSWNAVEGAEGYEVYRDGERIADTASTVYLDDSIASISKTDENPFPLNKEYTYNIRPYRTIEGNRIVLDGKSDAGSLFAPPKNIRASKGTSATEIALSWDPEANADHYEIVVWEGTGEYPAGPLLVTTDTRYSDSAPMKGVYYAVRSVNEDGVRSEWQQHYAKETDGTDELWSNYGYKSAFTASTAPVDAEGYYKPYVVLRWKKAFGADSYMIRLNGSSTVLDAGSANQGSSDEKGFFAYSDEDMMYTYNDSTGFIIDSVEFSGYSVIPMKDGAAMGELSSMDYVTRALKPEEYAILLNIALKPQLRAADSQFSGDWFPPTGASFSSKQNTYNGTGIVIKSHKGGGSYTEFNHEPGSMVLSGFQVFQSLSASSESIMLHARNGGAAGYLGSDPLDYIGNGTGAIVITDSSGRYKDATLVYNVIKVDSADESSSYSVTIDGVGTVFNDSASIPRPF